MPCGQKGGIQLRLLPFAVGTFLAYSVGFPMALALILIKNHKLIMEDQVWLCPALAQCKRWDTSPDSVSGGGGALHMNTDIVPPTFVQILRAYGLGQRKLDNPNAYNLRRTLHKMYFHFKPEFWYWKIGIMIRKFFIVVAGGVLLRSVALLFRDPL